MVDPDVEMMQETAKAMTPVMSGGVIVPGADNGAAQLLTEYLPMILTAIENSGVTLEGDAKDMFRMIRKENNSFRKANGVSAFA